MNNTSHHATSFFHLTWRKLLDYLIFAALLILASFPLSRLPFWGGARGLNAEAPLQIIIAVFLIARLLVRKPSGSGVPLFIFSVMFLVYSLFSVIFLGLSLSTVLGHAQLFFPFFVACLFLWTGFSVEPDRLLYGLALAIGVSALVSLYIFYFAPQLLLFAYSDQQEQYTALLNWGRNFWRGGGVVYFSWMAVMLYRGRSRGFNVLLILSLIAAVLGLISTFSRTHIIALIFFVLAGLVIINPRLLKRVGLRFVVIAVALWMVGSVYFSIDAKVPQLFESRVIGALTQGTKSLSDADVSLRQNRYEQYWERFIAHPILGQGLGAPYEIYPTISYYSDVTLVSFILPFGMIGLFCFGSFIYTMWKMLARVKQVDFRNISRTTILLIFTAFLVALNDNIFAYKPFIIYLAALIASIAWHDKIYRKNLFCEKAKGH